MTAALELRHDVFCVEQGVPEHDELDGRDHEGIHLAAVERRRAARDLPDRDRRRRRHSSAGSRFGAGAPPRNRDRAARPGRAETRAAGRRRVVLHAQTYAREPVRAGRLSRRAGRVFREAGIEHIAMEKHSSRPSRPAPFCGRMPEVRIDPLTGLRAIVAGDARRPPGRRLLSARPPSRSIRAPIRSPRATRTARRPSSTRCGRAAASPTPRAGPSASCRTSTRR